MRKNPSLSKLTTSELSKKRNILRVTSLLVILGLLLLGSFLGKINNGIYTQYTIIYVLVGVLAMLPFGYKIKNLDEEIKVRNFQRETI